MHGIAKGLRTKTGNPAIAKANRNTTRDAFGLRMKAGNFLYDYIIVEFPIQILI